MAVMIKDFNMPSCCYHCTFCDYEFGRCLADSQERYTEGYGNINPDTMLPEWMKLLHGNPMKPGKPDWCPLVEVEK